MTLRIYHTMTFSTSALAVSIALLSSGVAASEPVAPPEAQRAFWSFTERIALASPSDGRDLQALIPQSTVTTGTSRPGDTALRQIAIAPTLSADNVAVVMGKNSPTATVSFDLSGSCIPFSAVRTRYPSLLVINHAANDLEWNTLGTQVADSIIAFWYKGTDFSCMRRVEIKPAADTLSQLNLD
ncbi:MAG TPA: hypothetical protein DIW85_16295 [Stenotrophomonas sp.]|jgi:hypothetical protein|nr:hypothetical protein [Stenotrophomonas sp.]